MNDNNDREKRNGDDVAAFVIGGSNLITADSVLGVTTTMLENDINPDIVTVSNTNMLITMQQHSMSQNMVAWNCARAFDEKMKKMNKFEIRKGLCLKGLILMTTGPHDTSEDWLEWGLSWTRQYVQGN